MNHHYRDRRKIDPARGDRLGDGSPNDADRIEIQHGSVASEVTLPVVEILG